VSACELHVTEFNNAKLFKEPAKFDI